jgi:pyridoxal phosphate enzyme (YggS family)
VKILKEINKQGLKNNKKINCLLQIHIAKEQNKFGFDLDEIKKFIELEQHILWENIIIKGVMGMATFTENKNLVKKEFELLRSNFEELKKYFTEDFDTLSMGMSGDYKEAILAGSNMVRIGSSIFGRR